MKNGGQIPWNALPICETFKISCLMGRLHTKDVLDNLFNGPIIPKLLGPRIVATGDTLYGAAFVKPPALGAVQRQKRSRSGSRSSSVFRGARGKDHDPVASKLCDLGRIEPRHSRGTHHQRMADQLSREGRRRDWWPVDCPSVATSHLHQILQPMYPGLGPRNLRELETLSEIMDQQAARWDEHLLSIHQVPSDDSLESLF